MQSLPARYLILNDEVKLSNRLLQTLLKGKLLRLGGSQAKGYTLYVVVADSGLVLGTIATGNFKEIKDAINIFCRTLQII